MTFDHYRAARTFRRVMDQPTESTSPVHLDLQAALITEEFQEFMETQIIPVEQKSGVSVPGNYVAASARQGV